MGVVLREALGVVFDRSIRRESYGVNVTSGAGLLPYRELDESVGLNAMAEEDHSAGINLLGRT